MVIITDSASDLPQEIRKAYGLKVIPTPVLIDGVDYLDGETLDAETFYRIQTEGKAEIKTYHINPDMSLDFGMAYLDGKEVDVNEGLRNHSDALRWKGTSHGNALLASAQFNMKF